MTLVGRHALSHTLGQGPVMTVKGFVDVVHTFRARWRGMAERFPGFRSGASVWRREAITLLATLAMLVMGYFVTLHFASRAVQSLINTCTAQLEIEFEIAEIDYPQRASPRALCQCVAQALLEKNGLVSLALVGGLGLDPINLEPVTEEDSQQCIDALWLPDIELGGLAR
jgi:hypothetical protein